MTHRKRDRDTRVYDTTRPIETTKPIHRWFDRDTFPGFTHKTIETIALIYTKIKRDILGNTQNWWSRQFRLLTGLKIET